MVIRIKPIRPITAIRIASPENVDLAEPKWNWFTQGEPPRSNPEYHTPYMKSFLRSNPIEMSFLTADNRAFLLELYYELSQNKVN